MLALGAVLTSWSISAGEWMPPRKASTHSPRYAGGPSFGPPAVWVASVVQPVSASAATINAANVRKRADGLIASSRPPLLKNSTASVSREDDEAGARDLQRAAANKLSQPLDGFGLYAPPLRLRQQLQPSGKGPPAHGLGHELAGTSIPRDLINLLHDRRAESGPQERGPGSCLLTEQHPCLLRVGGHREWRQQPVQHIVEVVAPWGRQRNAGSEPPVPAQHPTCLPESIIQVRTELQGVAAGHRVEYSVGEGQALNVHSGERHR